MTTISAHIFVFEFIAMDWALGPGELKQRMHVKRLMGPNQVHIDVTSHWGDTTAWSQRRGIQTKYYTPQCDVTPKRARLGPIRSLTAVL